MVAAEERVSLAIVTVVVMSCMGVGASSEVELQRLGGRISKAVWAWLVPLASAFQLFSWRVRLSLKIKIEEILLLI